jgi:hypothetical protein
MQLLTFAISGCIPFTSFHMWHKVTLDEEMKEDEILQNEITQISTLPQMPGLAFHFPSSLGNNTLPSINQMLKILIL